MHALKSAHLTTFRLFEKTFLCAEVVIFLRARTSEHDAEPFIGADFSSVAKFTIFSVCKTRILLSIAAPPMKANRRV
jgi:hypothetical protein